MAGTPCFADCEGSFRRLAPFPPSVVLVLFIDSLEQGGLALQAHRPGDRRAYNVILTAEGARRLALIGPRLAATEDAFLDVLSATDRAGLAAMLARLDQGPPSSAT